MRLLLVIELGPALGQQPEAPPAAPSLAVPQPRGTAPPRLLPVVLRAARAMTVPARTQLQAQAPVVRRSWLTAGRAQRQHGCARAGAATSAASTASPASQQCRPGLQPWHSLARSCLASRVFGRTSDTHDESGARASGPLQVDPCKRALVSGPLQAGPCTWALHVGPKSACVVCCLVRYLTVLVGAVHVDRLARQQRLHRLDVADDRRAVQRRVQLRVVCVRTRVEGARQSRAAFRCTQRRAGTLT